MREVQGAEATGVERRVEQPELMPRSQMTLSPWRPLAEAAPRPLRVEQVVPTASRSFLLLAPALSMDKKEAPAADQLLDRPHLPWEATAQTARFQMPMTVQRMSRADRAAAAAVAIRVVEAAGVATTATVEAGVAVGPDTLSPARSAQSRPSAPSPTRMGPSP